MCASDLREKPKLLPRILAWALVVFWAALIFVLSSIPGSEYPPHHESLNVVAHFCLYLVLGVLLTVAVSQSRLPLWQVAIVAFILGSLYGASDEVHQLFVDGRNADPMDWIIDTIATAVGVVGALFYISARKVTDSRERDAALTAGAAMQETSSTTDVPELEPLPVPNVEIKQEASEVEVEISAEADDERS
ncbi:MAG: VanZ family protein [Coriobacteriia bacterium]|jgi:VanZ family protein|nr:VanZ family protein [Coriobacteriia bacterium]MDR2714196.1 VanZ family protein [Coriobacteriales bacterium]